jgi:hypothetical protein
VTEKPTTKRRKRPVAFRTITVKLFKESDRDLIEWWERQPDGERSEALRGVLRAWKTSNQAVVPATNLHVQMGVERVNEYAYQVADQEAKQLAALHQQISTLTALVQQLSAQIASGVVVAGQPVAQQAPIEAQLDKQQEQQRLKKVLGNKW